MVLVNTCGFIESAKEEAIENILEACSYKEQNPGLKVVVTGCLAERYRSQIPRRDPEVDAVCGLRLQPDDRPDRRPCGGGRAAGELRPQAGLPPGRQAGDRYAGPLRLPQDRGGLQQPLPLLRHPADPGAAAPAGEMDDCVWRRPGGWPAKGSRSWWWWRRTPTAYGEDWGRPGSICALLDRLNEIEGIEWIRILYAYPERITDDFIAAMQRNPQVLPYLDLPIQHCNDEILAQHEPPVPPGRSCWM